jgi:flagellar hook protein FlgE
VTSDGLPVQGFTATDPVTGDIITTGQPGNILVPPGVLRAPTPTSQFGTVTNLNADAILASEFTASVQIYDALGSPHVATITYTNTAAGAWDYEITVPGEEVAGGTAGTPEVIGTGTITFDGNGILDQVNGAAAADVVITSPAWANGATATDFTWDLVDANGVATITGYDGPSATSSVTQNGAAAGTINSISINSEGEILATFGTGSSVAVGQLAMANFNNPQGLVKLGSNRYGESASAGIPNVGIAGTGGRGSLIGSSLEQSNVDIAQEFTQMILAQRGYQANSKSITVADELLVDTLNLKR